MVEVTRKKYPLNPTLKWTDAEGRLTAQGFRIIRAIGELIENITIVDGEVTTDMIAAGAVTAGKITVDSLEAISAVLGNVVVEGDLIVEGTLTTTKLGANAVTEVTTGDQVGIKGPSGDTIVSVAVPVTSTGNTGVLVTFTGFATLPSSSASNFGLWALQLYRDASLIGQTPFLYYDDNFSYPIVASFIDEAPGTNPTYSIVSVLSSGDGNFRIEGGLLNCSLLKR